MPIVPVRNLGAVGVVKDVRPQEAPPGAWTAARNVRFNSNGVSRSSIFKHCYPPVLYATSPVGVFRGSATSEGYLITAYNDGTLTQDYAGVRTNVTPASIVPGIIDSQITSATLGGVTYLNFPGRRPYQRLAPSSGVFAPLPGWSNSDFCRSMRPYKDYLLALNVTKSDTNYAGMVKWSDAAQYGAPPLNWDTASLSSNAGETIINDINGSLVDGLALADAMIIYGEHQTFRCDFIGQPLIFRFSKLFDNRGVMAENCVAEVNGSHYVFGRDDIYVHNGYEDKSLCGGVVRKHIFNEINFTKSSACFIVHHRVENELWFCYPTVSDEVSWSGVEGCNKAAVYNYGNGTWTFIDLPSIVGSCMIHIGAAYDWTLTGTWAEQSASWLSFVDSTNPALLVASRGNPATGTGKTAYFVDDLGKPILPNPVAYDTWFPAFAERVTADLDELGVNLSDRKLIRSVTPQYVSNAGTNRLSLTVGASRTPKDGTYWGRTLNFIDYSPDRYDCRLNDRYLSIRFDIPVRYYAEISGYDLDIERIAGR